MRAAWPAPRMDGVSASAESTQLDAAYLESVVDGYHRTLGKAARPNTLRLAPAAFELAG